ncbi:MAG: tRNA glutamyl-Q(34) synthetase GluQRS, partial [Bradymonadaceae bacterium]|nr:tRNA glutamyl-Q(34) synthetase GluQRS [Lujinxingiaceae bacterium]
VDLLESTPRQIELFEAMGFALPRFWHVPLMLDAQQRRLSKRDGADSLQDLRYLERSPASVVGELAASLGLVSPGSELSLGELLGEVTLDALRQLRGAEAQF